jgi:hypothetical protein
MTATADAVARETAWLQTTGDSLPSLLGADGGPWLIIDAYTNAAATRTQQPAIYVTREPGFENIRVANQRTRPRYKMKLECRWPVLRSSPGSSSIAAETQADFDAAVELLRQRVAGPLGDKTHGGRFLSAAVAHSGSQPDITWTPEPADSNIKGSKELRGSMTYLVDDYEVSN